MAAHRNQRLTFRNVEADACGARYWSRDGCPSPVAVEGERFPWLRYWNPLAKASRSCST
jgi:hypothetical protein